MNQEKIERFALSQYLSEWPDHLPYETVLDLIMEEDEQVVIWQPFEDYSAGWVTEHIEEMVTSMNYWFSEEITNG